MNDRVYCTERFVMHYTRSQDNLVLTVYRKPKALQGRLQPLQMVQTKVQGWNKLSLHRKKMQYLLLTKKITRNRNSTLQAALNAL